MDTGTKTLIEASFNDDWGTGVPLGHGDCLNTAKWKTEGILGCILMKIQEEVTNSNNMETTSKMEESDSSENNATITDI